MIRILVLMLTALVLIGLSVPNVSADTSAGWAAYRAGKYSQALKELQGLADTGDATAAYYLGTAYSDGLAVRRDYQEAARWYRRAAEKGHTEAQFVLGFLYLNGAGEGATGIASDKSEAAHWLKFAAERDHPMAQYYLGNLYLEGRGVAVDTAEGLRWSLKAAERGYAGAQYNVALIQSRSPNILVRLEAYAWFMLAERQGYPGAHENLALLAADLHPMEIARAKTAADAWRPGMRLTVGGVSG
jgi:TPR repeat protein